MLIILFPNKDGQLLILSPQVLQLGKQSLKLGDSLGQISILHAGIFEVIVDGLNDCNLLVMLLFVFAIFTPVFHVLFDVGFCHTEMGSRFS
jgi:hypothetical protein